ncbi:MAG: class I SAM-dependent methyltransferase [Tissierellia bacterium]|nr:class I SAM-dependent methyltransferase [Tissierellia bacterium]
MKLPSSAVQLAPKFWSLVCHPHGIAVDATVGNGHDTLALARKMKYVYGFDIQREALKATQRRLEEAGLNNVNLILDSHGEMARYVPQGVDLVVFNLGYLPGSNKKIITRGETTVAGLEAGLGLLNRGGILTVCVYRGHPGAGEEEAMVDEFVGGLDQGECTVLSLSYPNQRHTPPKLYVIQKK